MQMAGSPAALARVDQILLWTPPAGFVRMHSKDGVVGHVPQGSWAAQFAPSGPSAPWVLRNRLSSVYVSSHPNGRLTVPRWLRLPVSDLWIFFELFLGVDAPWARGPPCFPPLIAGGRMILHAAAASDPGKLKSRSFFSSNGERLAALPLGLFRRPARPARGWGQLIGLWGAGIPGGTCWDHMKELPSRRKSSQDHWEVVFPDFFPSGFGYGDGPSKARNRGIFVESGGISDSTVP